jgi:hypothetical protein
MRHRLSKPLPAVAALEILANIGKLKREPPVANETAGLIASGVKRLHDATNDALSFESRFDLAYSAAYRSTPSRPRNVRV